MTKHIPRMSIGVPVYNGEQFLASTLESLCGQTWTDFEIIISDNASTDGTEDIARSFTAKDSRIEYIRQAKNLGASANYNVVVHRSLGEFFKWAAHDDKCEPTFIEKCIALLDEHPDAVLAYPKSVLIDDNDTFIEPVNEDMNMPWKRASQRLRHFLWNTSLCHPVFGVIRSEALAQTGLIGPFHSSDVTLLIQLLLQGKFVECPEPLFLRRMHAGTSLWNKSDDEVTAWYDTSSIRKRVPTLRYSRLLGMGLKSVITSPVPLWNKPICAAVLMRAYVTRRREIASELWQALKTAITR